jgi:hypothetical protein
MEQPVALKLVEGEAFKIFTVKLNEMLATGLRLNAANPGPTILVAHSAVDVSQTSTVLVDLPDISAVYEGSRSQAILVIIPEAKPRELGDVPPASEDDIGFVAEAKASTPHLAKLAEELVRQIRSRGVVGRLLKKGGGRWVNDPVNSFTLKIQPRVNNIQFTIYGNPETFEDADFLKKDQNSYSRGWVRDLSEVQRFAELVAQSFARKST